MKAVRHPQSPEGQQAKLAVFESKVRTLKAQLKAALAERDALRSEVGRLQSVRDDNSWRAE